MTHARTSVIITSSGVKLVALSVKSFMPWLLQLLYYYVSCSWVLYEVAVLLVFYHHYSIFALFKIHYLETLSLLKSPSVQHVINK